MFYLFPFSYSLKWQSSFPHSFFNVNRIYITNLIWGDFTITYWYIGGWKVHRSVSPMFHSYRPLAWSDYLELCLEQWWIWGGSLVSTSFILFSDGTLNMYPVHNWSGNEPAWPEPVVSLTPRSFVVPSLFYILDTVVRALLVLCYSTKISIAHKERLAASFKWWQGSTCRTQ